MTPDNYKSPEGKYIGPERRMDEKIQTALNELSTNVKLVQQEIKSLDAKVEQRLVDNSKVVGVQLSGIEKMLDQQRRETEVRRADDLQQHKDMISSFKEQTNVLVDLYKNHEREQDARFDAIEGRIDALELAPGQKAISTGENIRNVIIGILATAVGGGIFAMVAAIARWDEFVAWIGGIK